MKAFVVEMFHTLYMCIAVVQCSTTSVSICLLACMHSMHGDIQLCNCTCMSILVVQMGDHALKAASCVARSNCRTRPIIWTYALRDYLFMPCNTVTAHEYTLVSEFCTQTSEPVGVSTTTIYVHLLYKPQCKLHLGLYSNLVSLALSNNPTMFTLPWSLKLHLNLHVHSSIQNRRLSTEIIDL